MFSQYSIVHTWDSNNFQRSFKYRMVVTNGGRVIQSIYQLAREMRVKCENDISVAMRWDGDC